MALLLRTNSSNSLLLLGKLASNLLGKGYVACNNTRSTMSDQSLASEANSATSMTSHDPFSPPRTTRTGPAKSLSVDFLCEA